MNCAIVLAGGKGTRMNSEIPKQFLVVGGKPLISYSLDVFEKSPFIDAIIIVTSQDYTGYMKALVKENGYKKIAGIALGGKERYDSVHSGLELIQTVGLGSYQGMKNGYQARTIYLSTMGQDPA